MSDDIEVGPCGQQLKHFIDLMGGAPCPHAHAAFAALSVMVHKLDEGVQLDEEHVHEALAFGITYANMRAEQEQQRRSTKRQRGRHR
jgi:hypothetical protein